MFTGIIEEVGILGLTGPSRLTVSARKVLKGTKPGDSIAINGVCLTATSLDNGSFSVEVMPETLQRTNLSNLHSGNWVNLERASVVGGRFGGHFVQGHVDGVGRVLSLTPENKALRIRFKVPSELARYIVEKGFIAVDGVSLTTVERDHTSFSVSLVAYTLLNTTLGRMREGDLVNLEVDILAKYLESLRDVSNSGVTLDFLTEHGFIKG